MPNHFSVMGDGLLLHRTERLEAGAVGEGERVEEF
jgi:hypothetical protein